MPIDSRVVCSTITLRHLALDEALAEISRLGFTAVDLGALPGVCDHVPYVLDATAVEQVAATMHASGLATISVNGDVGDLNLVLDEVQQRARMSHAEHLLDLCVAVGARALVLPNGAQCHEPVTTLEADLDRVAEQLSLIAGLARGRGIELWVEAPHFFRLAFDLDRAEGLLARLPKEIGAVCDVSHIVAGGGAPQEFLQRFAARTRHVHLRDAEPGYIHHSIGNGQVDFSAVVVALFEHDFTGRLALELETRDVEDADRPAAALRAGEQISALLQAAGPAT